MTTNTPTPFALYKANLELALRIGQLLNENRKQWARQGLAGVDQAVGRTLDESERAMAGVDWTRLAGLPVEGVWNTLNWDALKPDVGTLKSSIDEVIAQQSSFASGLHEAVEAWQRQCGEAVREAGLALPTTTGFEDFLKVFTDATKPASGTDTRGPKAGDSAKRPTRRS
ncbi:MAG: hypothetical protein NVV68_04200 [Dokdonella sp.]|jgi:hypothetical protein|nr:hypothetical protein [Dokdonella sp.]